MKWWCSLSPVTQVWKHIKRESSSCCFMQVVSCVEAHLAVLMRTRCKYVYIFFQLFLFQSAEKQKILCRSLTVRLSSILQFYGLRNPLISLNSNLLCFEICPVIGS